MRTHLHLLSEPSAAASYDPAQPSKDVLGEASRCLGGLGFVSAVAAIALVPLPVPGAIVDAAASGAALLCALGAWAAVLHGIRPVLHERAHESLNCLTSQALPVVNGVVANLKTARAVLAAIALALTGQAAIFAVAFVRGLGLETSAAPTGLPMTGYVAAVVLGAIVAFAAVAMWTMTSARFSRLSLLAIATPAVALSVARLLAVAAGGS